MSQLIMYRNESSLALFLEFVQGSLDFGKTTNIYFAVTVNAT